MSADTSRNVCHPLHDSSHIVLGGFAEHILQERWGRMGAASSGAREDRLHRPVVLAAVPGELGIGLNHRRP